MTNEEETLKEFDEKFGKAGPERNSDSEGRIAGCDDCSSSVELRQEHRDFLIAKLKAQDKIAREEERETMREYHRKQIEIQNHFLTEYEQAPFEWHKGRKIEAEEALNYLSAV